MHKSLQKILTIFFIQLIFLMTISCRGIEVKNGGDEGSDVKLTGSVALASKKYQSRLVKINFIPKEGNLFSICTGAFVRPNVVLTAAHCLRSVPLRDATIEFLYGENATKVTEMSFPFERSGVSFFYSVEGSDIALIYVDSLKANGSSDFFKLPPACHRYSPSIGYQGKVKIMGRRKNGQELEKGFSEVSLPIKSLKFMEENIGKTIEEQARPVGYGPFLEVSDSNPRDVNLATGGNGGDSGGPWVQEDTVIGVTSFNILEQQINHTYSARICDFSAELENIIRTRWFQ
jgi:hypothetical protein